MVAVLQPDPLDQPGHGAGQDVARHRGDHVVVAAGEDQHWAADVGQPGAQLLEAPAHGQQGGHGQAVVGHLPGIGIGDVAAHTGQEPLPRGQERLQDVAEVGRRRVDERVDDHQPGHPGVGRGHAGGQGAAHGEPGHDDPGGAASGRQPKERLLRRRRPISPPAAGEILGRRAVTWQQRHLHLEAGAAQGGGQAGHRVRRPGEAVQHERARSAAHRPLVRRDMAWNRSMSADMPVTASSRVVLCTGTR